MCMYCGKPKMKNEHFACDICGEGICNECYDLDVEHDLHYHRILEACNDEEQVKLITKACGGEPEYLCERCLDKILKKTTPPKNRLFLADIGYPHYVLAHWNKVNNQYIFAEIQLELYQGEWDDVYFQTEYFEEEEIKSWIELPSSKHLINNKRLDAEA